MSEQAARELLTLVSHELRTPLTSIVGYVQVLRDALDGAGPAERRSLEILERNAARLQRLVDDLLLAADVSRGELGLQPGEVCMRTVVRDAVDAARPVADARDVVVDATLGAVGVVDGDACRLAQVLDNLLANAIAFSPEGGRVHVRLEQDGGTAAVELRDEGIGVGEADLGRVSQPFFRATTARAARVPGLGLGLSLSKAIVEGHGGVIRFASVEGEGTTVTVLLPAAPATERAVAA